MLSLPWSFYESLLSRRRYSRRRYLKGTVQMSTRDVLCSPCSGNTTLKSFKFRGKIQASIFGQNFHSRVGILMRGVGMRGYEASFKIRRASVSHTCFCGVPWRLSIKRRPDFTKMMKSRLPKREIATYSPQQYTLLLPFGVRNVRKLFSNGTLGKHRLQTVLKSLRSTISS